MNLPTVYLARHGETAWSLTGQHTGLSDLPLIESGVAMARALKDRLAGLNIAKVYTSPLQRAAKTCELAGFGAQAEIEPDLVEWNYGAYDGRTSADIQKDHPGWEIFRDGCPGGETLAQVAARADRVIKRARSVDGNVLLFGSGHILRIIGARWLGLDAVQGYSLFLNTASVSELGYEHNLTHPVIRLWNDHRHVAK